jgi:hypothetical protein
MAARSRPAISGEPSIESSLKVFICYRRSDGQDAAGRLASELLRLVPLNDDEVFVDTESLTVGQLWKQEITDVITSRDAFIAVISPSWTVADDDGKLRIRKQNDPVRVELETAIEAGVPIFPVRVGGARVPAVSELPRSLRGLPELHAIELRHEHYSGDIRRLVDALRSTPRRAARPAPRTTRVRPRRPATLDGPRQRATSNAGSRRIKPSRLRPIGQWPAGERDVWLGDWQKRAAHEEQEKAERRSTRPKFYETGAWRLAVGVTLLATAGAVVATDLAVDWLLGLFDLGASPVPPLAMLLFAFVWAATYLALGTTFYANDPGRGSRIFYTRGLLGGWVLAFDDVEEVAGFAGAFPINIIIGWALARGVSMAADAFWGVDQIGIFLLVLIIWTLTSVANYAYNTIDQL